MKTILEKVYNIIDYVLIAGVKDEDQIVNNSRLELEMNALQKNYKELEKRIEKTETLIGDLIMIYGGKPDEKIEEFIPRLWKEAHRAQAKIEKIQDIVLSNDEGQR